MAAVTISNDDLAPFAVIGDDKAEAMIADALAMAARVAPCVTSTDLSDIDAAAFKAILRGAILRWNEAGTGAFQSTQTQVGPFGQTQAFDNRQARRAMFLPSEIKELQDICKGDETSGAFNVDTVSTGLTGTVIHSDICALNFGALYCSCGAAITGLFPLYEVDHSGG